MSPKPNEEQENLISNKFIEKGFIVESSGYHKIFPKDVAILLSRHYDATSLYLRSRTDRIVEHKNPKIESFQLEIKSHESSEKSDVLFELVPFGVHLTLNDYFSIKCLYVYTPKGSSYHYCMWVEDIPLDNDSVMSVNIPTRWHKGEAPYELSRKIIRDYFPNKLPLCPPWDPQRQSGDPYVVFHELSLKNWQRLDDFLDKYLKNGSKITNGNYPKLGRYNLVICPHCQGRYGTTININPKYCAHCGAKL